MKSIGIFFLIIISSIRCHSVDVKNGKNVIDSSHLKLNSIEVLKPNLKTKVQGIWGSNISENAVFEIRPDSIYNVDQFKTYPYEIIDSIITIQYADFTFKGRISFIKDTMVIESDGEKSKYWKFKD